MMKTRRAERRSAAKGLREAIDGADCPTLEALACLLEDGDVDITSAGVVKALGSSARHASSGEYTGSVGWWMLVGPLTSIAEEVAELSRESRKK